MTAQTLRLATIALVIAACGSTSPSSPAATSNGEQRPGPGDAGLPSSTLAPAPAVDVATVFPRLDGFSYAAPTRYSPANLYDYINGAAELFIRYGFEELHSLEYSRGQGADESALTVDIYRHSSANHGYGIYSRDRIRAQTLADIGAAAAYQPGALNFLKGRYYVKLSSYQLGDADAELLAGTARTIAAALDGTAALPAEASCFPTSTPPPTVEYHASGYLGHGFLESVFSADFARAKVFIVAGSSAALATEIRDRYVAVAEKKGLTPTVDGGITRFTDPYRRELGEVHTLIVGRFLCGVITTEKKLASDYLRQIETNLGNAGLRR